MKKFKLYLESILLPVVLGGMVGLVTSGFMDYSSLNKPKFAPPKMLFPVAWTILYILMGLSYGILESQDLHDKKSKRIYAVQLFINLLWPIFFFVFKWRLFSVFWLAILILCVILMIFDFYKKNKLAGVLQFPYLVWIVFAFSLNLGIWVLNQ